MIKSLIVCLNRYKHNFSLLLNIQVCGECNETNSFTSAGLWEKVILFLSICFGLFFAFNVCYV